MVILIAGATHSGKTMLAQRLLEHYQFPYLSIDHLKMGLIRSGYCPLTPESPDREMTAYLWPVVREIIRTNIENRQNLIIEGCYIPFDFHNDFTAPYLEQIRYRCLILSEHYLNTQFDAVLAHANIIESRLSDHCVKEALLLENRETLAACKTYGLPYSLVDGVYEISIEGII